jgi:transcriptional regulator with XRE-family HTH domain
MSERIYKYLDYREAIKDLSKINRISYKSLASSARIHTSYFSRVMQSKAGFSREQLFLIGQDLQFNAEQLDFFMVLGEYDNSSLADHRQYLLGKIKKIQDDKNRLINNLPMESKELTAEDKSIYYQESMTAKVHMLLTIDKYRANRSMIAKKLSITDHKLDRELEKLAGLNLIEFKGREIELLKSSVHLEEADPLSLQNHINWRLETIHYLTKRYTNPSDYHLSAMFSCDEESKNKIKEEFKHFIIKVQQTVKESKNNDEAYFIGFDLY